MKIAIITGASSGMGREFVHRVDGAYPLDELWVIARRAERLESLASEGLRARVRPLAMDLCAPSSLDALRELLAKEEPEIAVLVNASGFGHFGLFEKAPLDKQLDIIDLNCKALTAVTYLCLPYLHEGSHVYQLGSLSAFQPVPAIGVYAASKAYVLSLARALNRELRPRGIRVLAVCPFWVRTEFFDRAVVDDTVSYYSCFFTPAQVVERALRDMRRGKDVSVVGAKVRLQVLATKLLPHRLVMAIWCRQQKIK